MNSLVSLFNRSKKTDDITIIDQCPSLTTSTDFVHDTQSFLLLLSQIEEIGWTNLRLSSSSNDNFLVTLHHTYIDMNDRAHDLEIDIPQRWPQERPRCRTHLPVDFNVEIWCPKTSRLIEIFQNFHELIENLQPFWNQLMDVERDAIILDQQPISFASTTRRLKINEHIHVQIQIDPFNSSAFPVITFHGPSMLVRTFEERLEMNRHHWSEAHSNIIVNLEHILDISFPTKFTFRSKSQNDDEHEQECGICYESTFEKSNGTTIYCETPNCYRQYHEKCWTSWLKKKMPQRGGTEVLDIVVDDRLATVTNSGPCLFCKKMIIVT